MERNEIGKTKIIRCSKCKRFVDISEDYALRCCPSCLDKLRNAYRQKRVFAPTKEDYAEKAKIELERQQELIERFGVSNEDCIKFRLQETNKDRGADWFNHVEICVECRKWMKNQGFDLNASSKKFDELKGYEEMFKDSGSPSSMGEDKKGFVSICSTCGTPLEKNGSCPMCARCGE